MHDFGMDVKSWYDWILEDTPGGHLIKQGHLSQADPGHVQAAFEDLLGRRLYSLFQCSDTHTAVS